MKTGYLIDMDGVIYRENQLIPGAADLSGRCTLPERRFSF
jgi:ribonucleotide monophosphatase NagD (HAD superfamily)